MQVYIHPFFAREWSGMLRFCAVKPLLKLVVFRPHSNIGLRELVKG